MKKRTQKTTKAKPKGVPADFPLWLHPSGRWCKKIRQKVYYFGKADDSEGALTRYLAVKDDLRAGRTPRATSDELTVRGLLNRFLSLKQDAVDTGELSPRSFVGYRPDCESIAKSFGLGRDVGDLRADDFAKLKRALAKTKGPASLRVAMTRVKSVFKFAYDSELIASPVRFGPGFKPPGRKAIAKSRIGQNPKLFSAIEINRMVNAARPALKAMCLLGINCGFGNSDCATLRFDGIDLANGWHAHARPKTQVPRRGPLWSETTEAIKAAIAIRPDANDPKSKDLVFLTPLGNAWGRPSGSTWQDAVGNSAYKLLTRLGLKRAGVGFYSLRSTFATVADEVLDPVAVQFLMGHAPQSSDMGAVYRQRISDERLVSVVDYVGKWLFGNKETE